MAHYVKDTNTYSGMWTAFSNGSPEFYGLLNVRSDLINRAVDEIQA
jgi:hypothetical protein